MLEEINKNGADWAGQGGLLAKLKERGYELAIEGSFGGADRPQFVVLLYRSKAVSLVSGSTDEVKIPKSFSEGTCIYDSLRPPVTARFKAAAGAFEFRIVGVHLKSNLRVTGADKQCDDHIRAFQAKQILAYLAELKKDKNEPQPIVVGDFNAPFTAPEYAGFGAAGYGSMIQGNCSAASIDQCSAYVDDPLSLIDHIVVHSSLTQAVQGSGAIAKVKVQDLPEYLKNQSDHVPVWASFRVDAN